MADLGDPSSYLALAGGEPVYTCDGRRIGVVEHVLSDPEADIFDGIVLDRSVLPGGHRFVDADQVEEVFERGLLLKVDAAAAEQLPEPSENPAVMRVDPDDVVDDGLTEKLRRAWDLISGRG